MNRKQLPSFSNPAMEKNAIHHAVVNVWAMPTDIQHAYLDKYYLLYWTPSYFDAIWNEGIITREGVDYIVVYHACKPADLRREKQIALSFRRAVLEFNLPAYVLVTFAKGCK